MHTGKQNSAATQVLLIEGHRHIRSPLEKVLIARGHRVTAVESGELGLDAIDNRYYDAVICNHQLPGISGMDFFSRSSIILNDTTTILTASYADNYLVNDAMAAGINVYLEMPFKIDNLLACVEGRYQEIYAGHLGSHLYITSGERIMAISPPSFNDKSAVNASKEPLMQKQINLPGRRWKLYLNPGATNSPSQESDNNNP